MVIKKKDNISNPQFLSQPTVPRCSSSFSAHMLCSQHSLDPYVSTVASANLPLMSRHVSVVPSSTSPLSDLKSHVIDSKNLEAPQIKLSSCEEWRESG